MCKLFLLTLFLFFLLRKIDCIYDQIIYDGITFQTTNSEIYLPVQLNDEWCTSTTIFYSQDLYSTDFSILKYSDDVNDLNIHTFNDSLMINDQIVDFSINTILNTPFTLNLCLQNNEYTLEINQYSITFEQPIFNVTKLYLYSSNYTTNFYFYNLIINDRIYKSDILSYLITTNTNYVINNISIQDYESKNSILSTYDVYPGFFTIEYNSLFPINPTLQIKLLNPTQIPITISVTNQSTHYNNTQTFTYILNTPASQIIERYNIYISNLITPFIYTTYPLIPQIQKNNITNNADITVPSTFFNNTSIYLIIAGGSISIFFIALILLLMKKYKYWLYLKLSNLDILYLKINDELPTEDLESGEGIVHLGIGYRVYERSTVLGGIFTIFIFFTGVFTVSSYLYDTINNNTIITVALSTSNGNSIPLSSSYIGINVLFKDVSYGQCVIPNTNKCINKWNIYNNNLNDIEPTCVQSTSSTDFSINCEVSYLCNQCQVDVGVDAYLFINYTDVNIAYKELQFSIYTSSYDGDSIITGDLSNDGYMLFSGGSTVLSVSITPVVYTEFGTNKKTGYILDYQNTFFSSTIDPANIEWNRINDIGTTIKISRNPSWMFIQLGQKTNGLIIFSQAFSIIGGLYAVSKALYNAGSHKYIRTLLYRFNLFKEEKSNTEITVKDKMKDVNDKIKYEMKIQRKRKKIHRSNSICNNNIRLKI